MPYLVKVTVFFVTELENEYHKALLENPEIFDADVSCLGMSVKTLNPAYFI